MKVNVIDLFSGGGGLTEGFVKEGYNIIVHIEKDKWACETLKTRICYHELIKNGDIDLYKRYLLNSKEYQNVEKNREIIFDKYPKLREKLKKEVLNYTFGNPFEDSSATNLEEIVDKIKESMQWHKVETIDLIIGGPPCQAYSLVGRGVMRDRVESDKRNYLFRYYKNIVEYFKPKAFIFENVPGILTAKKGEIYQAIVDEFKEIGYTLLSGVDKNPKLNIINASELGIPQTRKRVILFGFREELGYSYPRIFDHRYSNQVLTTSQVISDLPRLQHGEGEYGQILAYPKVGENALSHFQIDMRDEFIGVLNHQARKHNERDLEHYKDVIIASRQGKRIKYTDFPEERRNHQNQDVFLDRYKVHSWNKVPHTILAHLAKDGHYNIHPDLRQCRSLTVREAARIQSFSDDYYFEGPRTAQFTQVGNAVPPLMAQCIAKALKDTFK